ncbi:hypothetical protein [Georgenia sunbinii]|uniref:hypothetical protein n=1 Tax=Georgenia sunbinii TaxID=3117728 RepID=UPI002F26D76B
MPPGEGRALADMYANATAVMLPGSHLDTVKRSPEGYRAALLTFLGSLPEHE